MYNHRLKYLHWNPVTAGFVAAPWHWICSSAIDYFTEKKGLLSIIILDGFLGSEISNREHTGHSR